MTPLRITVPAVPVAQPRPRASSRGGHTRVHTPTSIKQADGSRKPHPILAFKATLKHAAALAYQGPPLECPLRVDVTFVMPRPGKLIWKTRAMPRVPHTIKPDRDNLDKAVMDALSGLLWRDDCQVCDGRIVKVIASGAEQPHVEIVVSEVTP